MMLVLQVAAGVVLAYVVIRLARWFYYEFL